MNWQVFTLFFFVNCLATSLYVILSKPLLKLLDKDLIF